MEASGTLNERNKAAYHSHEDVASMGIECNMSTEGNARIADMKTTTTTSTPTNFGIHNHHTNYGNQGYCNTSSLTKHAALETKCVRLLCVTAANGDVACPKCGGIPCYWLHLAVSLGHKTSIEYPVLGKPSMKKNAARTTAYKAYVYERYGFLGAHNRVQLPHCALKGIRALWLDEMGAYMGFKKD